MVGWWGYGPMNNFTFSIETNTICNKDGPINIVYTNKHPEFTPLNCDSLVCLYVWYKPTKESCLQ